MKLIANATLASILLASVVGLAAADDSGSIFPPTNLLMIMFDDLRPELSIYGRSHMITPNFERLANKSVVFDYAFCQVAVCNPSRDSMLTGLRPDTVGTYGFQNSFAPHMILPQQLVRSGYNTAGYGKTLHWDGANPNIWSYDSWENNWYEYQGSEGGKYMNASVMPDKVRPEEWFRDYEFTSRTIETMHKLVNEVDSKGKPKNFMVSIGFKLPHLAVHVPYKYYEMYRNRTDAFQLSKKELRFPLTANEAGFRIGETWYTYMKEEGAVKSEEILIIGDINMVIPDRMRLELMWTYCAAVTFLDVQIGRLLDTMDKLNLWQNTTVVLSADHGMHNGEKGIWEKWTLFDESTRVPLLISHPKSPFKGSHYRSPVELIDIYPTVLDLLQAPYDKSKVCQKDDKCKPLQGKSLAGVILGDELANKIDDLYVKRGVRPDRNTFDEAKRKKNRRSNGYYQLYYDNNMINGSSILGENKVHDFKHNFALSQTYRCGKKDRILDELKRHKENPNLLYSDRNRHSDTWIACDRTDLKNETIRNEVTVMGYAMRTPFYKYIAWVHFDKKTSKPRLHEPLLDEELYDHRQEKLSDFTHRELVNVAKRTEFTETLIKLRDRLLSYLKKDVQYGDSRLGRDSKPSDTVTGI